MTSDDDSATRASQQLIAAHFRNGGADFSSEDVLGEYRMFHPTPEQHADNVEAVKKALSDMENGDRGIPFEEFDRAFREQHNIPLDG